MLDELHNLARISDRILMLATADHPEYLRPERLSVSSLLQRIGDRWRIAADRDWRVASIDGPHIDVDADQVERALDAVIENAVKHTVDGDMIRVTATSDGMTVVIEIDDTGTGIANTDLPHVFERFYGTGSGARRGTGLGLAIVRSVVDAHDGRVAIQSQPGSGTTVTLSFPQAPSTAVDPPPRLSTR